MIKKLLKNTLLSSLLLFTQIGSVCGENLPDRKTILKTLELVNDTFMRKHADVTAPSFAGRQRPSNIWTRGVYYEGLMALYEISPKEAYYKYALDWAEFHRWGFRDGNTTRNADNYCAAQTYIDLYKLCPAPHKLMNTRANMQMLVNTPQNNDWTWIDAVQMGMPVLVRTGVLENDKRYFDKAWEMYAYTRNTEGKNGLWNPVDGLWWRDADFCPPYKEPNGEDCYWSRGNGWVFAALVRVLDVLPAEDPHRKIYLNDFKKMTKALMKCQRPDGFWNVSLHDSTHFGGKETSGTALFAYGMAWGIRKGILSRTTCLPVVVKAWNALCKDAVHPDGVLGYVQGTGKEPKDGQPVTYDSLPDFEDYGTGCFLLAGAEVYKL